MDVFQWQACNESDTRLIRSAVDAQNEKGNLELAKKLSKGWVSTDFLRNRSRDPIHIFVLLGTMGIEPVRNRKYHSSSSTNVHMSKLYRNNVATWNANKLRRIRGKFSVWNFLRQECIPALSQAWFRLVEMYHVCALYRGLITEKDRGRWEFPKIRNIRFCYDESESEGPWDISWERR
jgi:hypothetical protein